jgi:hypothetical protein
MLKQVQYLGTLPRQLDLPRQVVDQNDPEKKKMRDVERTSKGALHLRPGAVHTISEDELQLAGERYKGLGRQLRVVGDVPERKAKGAPAPEPTPTPSTESSSDSKDSTSAQAAALNESANPATEAPVENAPPALPPHESPERGRKYRP